MTSEDRWDSIRKRIELGVVDRLTDRQYDALDFLVEVQEGPSSLEDIDEEALGECLDTLGLELVAEVMAAAAEESDLVLAATADESELWRAGEPFEDFLRRVLPREPVEEMLADIGWRLDLAVFGQTLVDPRTPSAIFATELGDAPEARWRFDFDRPLPDHPDGPNAYLIEVTDPAAKPDSPLLPGGFDLRLMSVVHDESGIPTEGENLVIVAVVDEMLHFRIFDAQGKRVVDKNEGELPERAREIEQLKGQLKDLWAVEELPKNAKDRVISSVTSIVGHTLPGLIALEEVTVNSMTVRVRAEELPPDGVWRTFMIATAPEPDSASLKAMFLVRRGKDTVRPEDWGDAGPAVLVRAGHLAGAWKSALDLGWSETRLKALLALLFAKMGDMVEHFLREHPARKEAARGFPFRRLREVVNQEITPRYQALWRDLQPPKPAGG